MKTYTVKVFENGSKHWYLNDKLHREDGPAVEYADGTKFWYLNGKCHRLDGPAMEYADGTKFWYLNGKCHRLDGPAFEHAGGGKGWYLDGKPLTLEEFNAKMKTKSCVSKTVKIDGVKYTLTPVEK